MEEAVAGARTLALAGVSALALGWTSPAAAQATGQDASPAPAAAQGSSGDVVVNGVRSASGASSGTKTDTPLVETPQSISVISSDEIRQLRLQNLNESLRYVPGVTPDQRGSSAEVYDLFSLRGFGAPVFLDGLFYVSQSDQTGYAAAQADISRIERVEVIKGPSSALYGKSGPGGLVAEESKLPLDQQLYGSLAGTYGTYDLYRVDGDIGGRFSDTALWRVYGSANGAHDQQQFGERQRQTISAATTLGNGKRTTLTLLVAYSHDPRNGDYGVFPAYGTLLPNPNGRVSTNFYGGEPRDFFSREQVGTTYILRHDFGGGWAFRASGRYQYVKSNLGIVYISGQAPDFTSPSSFARGSYSTAETNNDWVYDNQLTGIVRTGRLTHELLFGADRQVLHFDENAAFGTATPINPYAPVYGTTATPRTPAQVPGGFPFETNTLQRQQSAYAQDQIAWGGLRVTLSGREDWAHGENGGPAEENAKFTYRVGGLYRTSLGIAPYVSYSTSFDPQAATLVDGSLAKPSLGRQFEAGVKYQAPGTAILLTAAYFNIDQTNVLSFDPVTFAATQSGKVRSRGVELEAKVPLPRGFTAMAAFSRQSVKVLADQDPNNVGHGLPTVGRGGLSGNLEWAPTTGPLKGFAIGGGVRHVDDVYAYGSNNSPDYTLVDALARYDLGEIGLRGVRVSIDAKNLGDKTYLTGCYVNYDWCWYGARRTVQGTIGFSF